ncbi:hypothetical protein RRG08_016807 [Elysia crispata]|uniref:Uncharacterized protein n=1 Tax=Elysia crispata TaxID=231223 RepID=A0AAE0ZZ38_9GAST|nr:hypothetical protein RRG08_016807 [Elysia crispata]
MYSPTQALNSTPLDWLARGLRQVNQQPEEMFLEGFDGKVPSGGSATGKSQASGSWRCWKLTDATGHREKPECFKAKDPNRNKGEV